MSSILISALLATSLCTNDTIVRAVRPDSVVIIESGGNTQVQIYGKKDQPGYTFTYTRSKGSDSETHLDEHSVPWDFNIPLLRKEKRAEGPYASTSPTVNAIDQIHLGLVLPVSRSAEARTHAGWNIGFDIVNVEFDLTSRKDAFFVGLGVENTTLFASKHWRWTKHEGQLTSIPYRDEARKRRSVWNTTSITLPLRYSHAFTSDLCLDFSIEPQWSVYNTVSNRYTIGPRSYKDTYHHVGDHRFNVAFGVAFRSEKTLGIYLKYQPMNALSSTSPANFKMLTMGFVL